MLLLRSVLPVLHWRGAQVYAGHGGLLEIHKIREDLTTVKHSQFKTKSAKCVENGKLQMKGQHVKEFIQSFYGQ